MRELVMLRGDVSNVGRLVATLVEQGRHHEADIGEVRGDLDTLSRTVASLQKWRWTVVGAAVAAAVVFSPVLQVIAR
jgi:hypothetical protein